MIFNIVSGKQHHQNRLFFFNLYCPKRLEGKCDRVAEDEARETKS